ncbi:MAG: AMP-binding protein, partial [Ignavibacteria bacterium]
MKKSGILFIASTIVLLSFSFWCFVGFKVIKTVSNKEELLKCLTILSSKYENARNSQMQRKEDSSIVANQNLYDAQKYDIKLSFDIPRKYVFGNVEMNSLNLSDTLNKIYINFTSAMKINSVKLNGSEASFKHINDYIIIDSKNKIKKAENFSVTIGYEGSPENKSFDSFGFKTFDNEPAVYTLSEPDYSSSWWPCKDLMDDKFVFSISLTVPEPLTAVSNGLLKESKDEGDGNKTFIWESNFEDKPNRTITYQQLNEEVCKLANTLKSFGVVKGDRVCIYMP